MPIFTPVSAKNILDKEDVKRFAKDVKNKTW